MLRYPSSDDFMAFVAEINIRRMSMVLNKRKLRLGGLTAYSQKHITMIAISRRLHQRYLLGDYTHNDEEWKSMNELGFWLLEEHQLNEHSLTPVRWTQFTAVTVTCPTVRQPGTYENYIYKARHD